MQINFNRQSLQDTLTLVTAAVPTRTPRPALECVKIENATVTATNLDLTISTEVAETEIVREGVAIVPAAKLFSIVKESKDDVVTIVCEDMEVTVTDSNGKFTLYGFASDQYPDTTDVDAVTTFAASLAGLKKAITHTAFAAAKESTRYALNGVLWGNGAMAATDGRRLSVYDTDSHHEQVVVPVKTLATLLKLGGEGCTVTVGHNQIQFVCGKTIITSNLIEGKFPKYQDIIPTNHGTRVELPVDDLYSAVRRASVLVSDSVKLSISPGRLSLSSRTPEIGTASVDMAVDYNGQAVEIGFNPAFLLDLLKNIDAETVTVELGDSERPGLFTAENFKHVIMPVKL